MNTITCKYMKGYFAFTLIIVLLFGFSNTSYSQAPIAIKGGTIITMAGDRIVDGVILIKDGIIDEIGKNITIPPNAKVIDAKGKYVMPGIIDAMCYYNIKPFPLNDSSPVTPQNRIIEGFNPYGERNRGEGGTVTDNEILSGGVTTVYIAPGDKQVIGGQGAIVKTYGNSVEDMTLREPAAMDMTIGRPAKKQSGSPGTRMAIAAMIRKALLGAQEYKRSLDDYNSKTGEDKDKAQKPSRKLNNEALLKLIDKELPARIEADYPGDIRTAIRIAEEFDIDIIIDSGLSASQVVDILKEKNIPVILGPPSHPFITGGEVSWDQEDYAILDEYNAAKLINAGVKVAIASYGFSFGSFGTATQARWLLLEAAYATGYGVSENDALKAITIYPAQILGVDKRIGSLEKGKDADIIILDGPPLDVKTWVAQVFINGKSVYIKE